MSDSGIKKESAGFSVRGKILSAGVSLAVGLWFAGGCADKPSTASGVVRKTEPSNTAPSKPVAEPTPVQPLKAQTIDFTNPGDQFFTNTVTLSAKASSGLPVAFGGMGPCRIQGGSILTFSGTGEVTIVAVQPGNKEWMQAPMVKQRFMVRDTLK
jgi:hypothetical protein